MRRQNSSGFAAKITKICKRKHQIPMTGQLELTYRCNLNCSHCYCKGSEDKDKELTTAEWKKIIDEVQKEGCLNLCFSGGEPLIREDFLELYAHAKTKGFLITIFTNGLLFTKKVIDYLEKSPPFSIEISLNGITKKTYETITQISGSFEKVIDRIKKLEKKGLKLILKSNCLKENKEEVVKIKAFTEQLLGKSKRGFKFKYDPFILPRLNGNRLPCNHRVSSEELLQIRHSDSEMWEQYEETLCSGFSNLKRNPEYLYHCNTWLTQFFVNPYGRLKFCLWTEDYSVDLRDVTFKEGFYNLFPRLLKEKFRTNSKCRDCSLRSICRYCPARAYLETGDKEAPVEYFCRLAEEAAERIDAYKNKKINVVK